QERATSARGGALEEARNAGPADERGLPLGTAPELPEVAGIRDLLGRLVASNEQHFSAGVRVVVLPAPEGITAYRMAAGTPPLTLASPDGDVGEAEQPEPPPEAQVAMPRPAVAGCSRRDFWGAGTLESDRGRLDRLFFLVWPGPDADAAALDFMRLAAESG